MPQGNDAVTVAVPLICEMVVDFVPTTVRRRQLDRSSFTVREGQSGSAAASVITAVCSSLLKPSSELHRRDFVVRLGAG